MKQVLAEWALRRLWGTLSRRGGGLRDWDPRDLARKISGELQSRISPACVRKRTFSLTYLRCFWAPLVEHPQIQIWRRDTAWNTTSTMLQWLDLLASRLLPFTEFQPILLLDMAPCHLSPVIAEKASSLGFFLAYVPARLTSLVQPADVAMFAGYKVNLVKLLLQNESLAGEVSLEAWIECLGKVCRQYLCGKKWKKAFERTGIIPGGILTPELAQIAAPRLCVSPLPCPDFDSVASLFPKGRRVPYTSLFWVPAQMDPPLLE